MESRGCPVPVRTRITVRLRDSIIIIHWVEFFLKNIILFQISLVAGRVRWTPSPWTWTPVQKVNSAPGGRQLRCWWRSWSCSHSASFQCIFFQCSGKSHTYRAIQNVTIVSEKWKISWWCFQEQGLETLNLVLAFSYHK